MTSKRECELIGKLRDFSLKNMYLHKALYDIQQVLNNIPAEMVAFREPEKKKSELEERTQ